MTKKPIPTLDRETLLAPVGDLLEEKGYDEVAEFLRHVANRGASFDFGAAVRIKGGAWTESSYLGRRRLNFGPEYGPTWISVTEGSEDGCWDIFIDYLGQYRSECVDGQASDATFIALELCRDMLRPYFEPLVTKEEIR